jgi:hypothetical protein
VNREREPRGRYELVDQYGRVVAIVNQGELYPTRWFPDELIGDGWPPGGSTSRSGSAGRGAGKSTG